MPTSEILQKEKNRFLTLSAGACAEAEDIVGTVGLVELVDQYFTHHAVGGPVQAAVTVTAPVQEVTDTR